MLFNSIDFIIFFPIVFILYWALQHKKVTYQNVLLLVASYFFYSCWDWRFLFLLLFSTCLDYVSGIKMGQAKNSTTKNFWFWLTILINIGFLGLFKYYNFFADSFADLLSSLGFKVHFWTLQVLLPVGISFYTFHGLSYVIDIYKDRIQPEHNFVHYALFVSYFPLLVAGPIERATHLLPQIKLKRVFSNKLAIQGVKQIIWGFFKKIVVADNCAYFVNQIFNTTSDFSSGELWLGAIFFAFQIYGDFSGYSDIALGTSKLFGIQLLRNFNFPYFAKDIADFWRRWHISLTTWFRDYLYIPLGGSKGSVWLSIRNTFIIFLVSGFWHGANWTFIAWGLLHAFLFLPLLLTKSNRKSLENSNYVASDVPKVLFTFLMVCIAWVFFRAENLQEALKYLENMLAFKKFDFQFFIKDSKHQLLTLICLISIVYMLFLEWINVKRNCFEIQLSKKSLIIVVFMLFFMGSFKNQLSFIYFQF